MRLSYDVLLFLRRIGTAGTTKSEAAAPAAEKRLPASTVIKTDTPVERSGETAQTIAQDPKGTNRNSAESGTDKLISLNPDSFHA
jgi:hypothetical protein